MDRFVKVIQQKETDNYTGHSAELFALKKIIETNGIVCVYGNYGVGKTHLVKHLLKNTRHIELTQDLARTNIMEKIVDTDTHIYVDDIEEASSMVKYKTKGALIIISQKMIEEIDCIQINPLNQEQLFKIGTAKFPSVLSSKIKKSAQECKDGNIRNFFFSIENFSFDKDIFKSPKDFIYDLICSDSKCDPSQFLGVGIHEHGYSWGIIHENYMDSANITINKLIDVSDWMSIADIKDEEMYHGYTHTSIFSLFGIVMPAIIINHSLSREKMRPGSAWTKHNNYKMRSGRYTSLTNRKFKTTVDIDSLNVIAQYCKSKPVKEVMPLLNTYGIESADMDMLNHLLLVNKIKVRTLQIIKKEIKENSK
jgi:hypothetical protein